MKYVCDICGYVYDPEVGDPDNGVAPGTPWEEVPEDWVCPLCGADATVGLFRQMLHGIRFNQRQSNLRRMDADTPVLFVAGDKDPVGSCGKGVIQSHEAFKAAGVRDCTLKLYPGLRHEILNEKAQQQQIFGDIGLWLTAKL